MIIALVNNTRYPTATSSKPAKYNSPWPDCTAHWFTGNYGGSWFAVLTWLVQWSQMIWVSDLHCVIVHNCIGTLRNLLGIPWVHCALRIAAWVDWALVGIVYGLANHRRWWGWLLGEVIWGVSLVKLGAFGGLTLG